MACCQLIQILNREQNNPKAGQSARPNQWVRSLRNLFGVALLGGLACASYIAGNYFRDLRGTPSPPPPSPKLDVNVLDVGDGSAMLLTTPGNHTILIDTGSRTHDATEVASLLRGRRSVDMIILSSSRYRSIGGFRALMDAIRVNGPVLLPGDAGDFRHAGRSARDVLAVLHERGIAAVPYDQYLLTHPNPLAGETAVQVAGLPVDTDGSHDMAMAIRVEYGASALLYAAGITAPEMADLLSHEGNLACDVLALPDGSRTAAPELLAQTGPQVITVTCDREHQPDDQTQRWLFASGARIGRTDLLGSFVLHLDTSPNQPVTWTYNGTPPQATVGANSAH